MERSQWKSYNSSCHWLRLSKTRIAIKVIKRLLQKKTDARILVVVPGEYLHKQWTLQLAEMNILQNVEVRIIDTAINRGGNYDLMILDEVHEFVSLTRVKIFTCIKYSLLLCLTATLERLDGRETHIFKYAPVCDKVSLSDCLANGWVAKYKEYKVMLDVDLTEYRQINSRFLNHFSFFNYDFALAMSCVSDKFGSVKKKLANAMGVQYKDVALHSAQFIKAIRDRKDWIWNHPKKIELANTIINHRKDKKILTFSQTTATANAIGQGLIMHSKQPKKKRAEIMDLFNEMDCGVLNSAKALERGADIKNLSVSITLSMNSSSIAKQQKTGRVIRKEDEKESEVFTFVIRGTAEEEWFNKSSKGLNYMTIDENELISILKGEEFEKKEEIGSGAQKSFIFRL